MAKEPMQSRLPMPGVSRIPLPGFIRPPSIMPVVRPSQLRAPSTFVKARPMSFSGLRPPTTPSLLLKKSSSGDHINSINTTMSLVGRKTTTALKKLFTKPPDVLQTPMRKETKPGSKDVPSATITMESTPRPLTRSDTFVRTDSPDANLIATPMPVIGGETGRAICESTPLLRTANKKGLYATQTFDTTFNAPGSSTQRNHNFESTRISNIGFGNTIDMESPKTSSTRMSNVGFGNTVTINTTRSVLESITDNLDDATHILGRPNETRAVNKTHSIEDLSHAGVNSTHTIDNRTNFLGQTLPVMLQKNENIKSTTITLEDNEALNRTLENDTKKTDESGSQTPASNATYSNPGSTENMLLLDDVSIPSGFEEPMGVDVKDNLMKKFDHEEFLEFTSENLDDTLTALAPNKTTMKLPLNSTMNTERLLDLTQTVNTPAKHMQLLNLTKDYIDTPDLRKNQNNTQLLYMTQVSSSCTTTPDRNGKKILNPLYQLTPIPHHLLSPLKLKQAQSDLALPTRTPDEESSDEPMDVDSTMIAVAGKTDGFFHQAQIQNSATSLQDVNNPNGNQKARFSFGLDLTESTLDCSIELVDVSLSSTGLSQPSNNTINNLSNSLSSQQLLKKQNSFDMDESLGILTPDQMKEFLDSTATNNTNNNLDMPLMLNVANSYNHKLAMHQMRIDQTPSPEELPLDPVEVKTDINEMVLQHQQHQYQLQQQHGQSQSTYANDEQHPLQNQCNESLSLLSETEPSKSESITKSSVSKISTSFITSVTSVTSLDTGYQGDGEMSRPASRGACDHSPSNGPLRKGVSRQPSFNQQQGQGQVPPVRRQDPMTDSDFFTESDADDIFHRGDRRAQVIDGQLYGPTLQPSASVFISEDPQMEDSCMESSGIFTDVENRGDEDLAQIRRQNTHDETQDLSPDLECDADSTETVRSNRDSSKRLQQHGSSTIINSTSTTSVHSHGQGHLSSSQTSSTIQSSMSTDRLSAATLSNRTSYCSVDGGGGGCGGILGPNCVDEFKSFSSLDEALDGESMQNHMPVKLMKSSTTSTTSWCEREQPLLHKHLTVLQNNSPRKQHSSLTSLCGGVNCQSSVQSITDSDRSFSCATTSTSQSNASSLSTNSPNANKKTTKSANNTPQGKHTPRSKSSSSTAITTPKSAKSFKLSPSGSGSGVGAKHNSPPAVRKYHHSPNKWEAVMNQIANNKALTRKNYNDVKPKVATRISVGGGGPISAGSTGAGASDSNRARSGGNRSGSSVSISPTVRRSPTNNLLTNRVNKTAKSQSSPHGVTETTATTSPRNLDNKRAVQNVNRVRSYSKDKDSQKSSQSDLSFASGVGSVGGAGSGSAGSPKLLAKTPLRAAKKRDVRNLSISPTDLGPPPKTQQTSNGTSTRPKPAVITLTQKRFNAQSNCTTPSPSTTSTAASTPTTGGSTTSIKGSPPLKKFQLNARRSDSKAPTGKTPLKDHNRILNQSKNNISKAETPTDLQENGISFNNNNNISATTAAATGTGAAAATTDKSARTNSRTSSPILSNINNKKTTPASSPAVANNLNEKKIQNKLHKSPSPPTSSVSTGVSRKSLLHKQHQQLSDDIVIPSAEPAVDDLQQLKLLNRHSCNGALNYEAFEQQQLQLQQLQQQSAHQSKSTEALGVLLQYLVYDLDAFACPSLKSENTKTKDKLKKTLLLLDEAKTACSELQDQLCDKDAYYTQRENELQALHRCELEKAQSSFLEFQSAAKLKILSLQTQLEGAQAEHRRTFDCYRMEMEQKLLQKQEELKNATEREGALQQRFCSLEISEQELKEKISQTESSCATSLQQSTEREQELEERLRSLTKELDRLKSLKESNERDLKDKLNLSNDEVAILRNTRRSLNENGVSSTRNTSSCSAMGNMELSRLQSEAESLRCVLELKQKEISKLTKQNEELLRVADEKMALQAKISLLESNNEMLLSEMGIKSDKEKEYLRQIDEIQKAFNHESVKRTRLSYDNEALQWQLKQRSEQLHLVESKLQELSAHDISSTSMTNRSSMNGSALSASVHMEDISPPTSPVIKGVIEKTDSVSWVLEMDDETPEVAASKMVKRAGSFRSVERSPSTRRQLSVSASAGQTSNSSLLDAAGPNPLSQSMSATSVIREHSKVETNEFNNRLHPRIRSKSVSVKSCEALQQQQQKSSSAKLSRQMSTGSSSRKNLDAVAFKEPVTASSPYSMRPRCSTLKIDNEPHEDILFRRSNAKLITCDTSALNKGERLEMRSLPSHPSVQDLKVIKKCQEIQESAGEAMVSGTNSEDESCSASSDDVVSTASSSANSESTSSSNPMKNSRMSIEEVLLIDKMNSLSGTPMEMSWSEDAEGITNSSTL
ncbi:serine-rich adhesin for platelets [Stomoxys calcitrans]|uniref:serine-rich adhesin for platelets n=1 Tax=Stomoxys calcitrans TaxID=35570 RepID=UPI0027E2BD75|nr:serine-rich adhesin for platelets [Stomoxys calcitrans]